MVALKVYKDHDVTVVELGGRLDREVVRPVKNNLVKSVMSLKGPCRIVFDVSDLEGIDTPGVALIVYIYKWCVAKGWSFELKNVNDRVKRILQLADLYDLLAA